MLEHLKILGKIRHCIFGKSVQRDVDSLKKIISQHRLDENV